MKGLSAFQDSQVKMFNPNLTKNKSYYMNFNLIIEVIKAYISYSYV